MQGIALRGTLPFPGEDLQLPGLTQAANQLQVDVVPAGRAGAVNLEDFQALTETGAGSNAAGLDRPGDRRNSGDTDHGDNPEGEHGQQEVGNRPGGNNGDTLLHGLAVEGLVQLLIGHRSFTLVEHLHVAAQRDTGNDELGTPAIMPAVQGRTETDGKTQHPHTTATGDPEVAVFVNGHQQPQGYHGGQQRKDQIHQCLFRKITPGTSSTPIQARLASHCWAHSRA